jgi:hypothetical protein
MGKFRNKILMLTDLPCQLNDRGSKAKAADPAIRELT